MTTKSQVRSHGNATTKWLIAAVLSVVSLLPGMTHAGSLAGVDQDILLQDIELRPGATVGIHLKVYVNEPHHCQGNVILAVPGFTHTAATWGPFAESIFGDNPAGPKVCRLVAIDLPGHGGSSLPAGAVQYGELTLEDYVTVLQAALERLRGLGIGPDTLLGHSQGGLLIQMLQQALKSLGTTLREEFNIKRVVLLASVGPQQIPWAFVDTGTAAILLQQFVAFDPVLGLHIAIPDAVWPAVFFSNLSGAVIAGAPTAADVGAGGFNAPEPLLAALELVGAPPFARPSVDAGIFGPGPRTTLRVATFEQDTLIRPSESARLYEHLTGDVSAAGVAGVFGPDAVHDMYISAPAALLNGIAGTIELP